MIVFPLIRSVGLRAATASSRVATLPMFIRSRPSRTRRTSSPSWARSGTTTKSIARPSAGRASGGPLGAVPPALLHPEALVQVEQARKSRRYARALWTVPVRTRHRFAATLHIAPPVFDGARDLHARLRTKSSSITCAEGSGITQADLRFATPSGTATTL